MKKKKIWGVLLWMFVSSHGMAQLEEYADIIDSLLTKPIQNGYMWFETPNTFLPGQCFEQYKIITGDTDNDIILKKSWTDPQISMNHYLYQQTYKDVPVEGALTIEHYAPEGDLIYTNAIIAIELGLSVTPQLTESVARKSLIDYFPEQYDFAWELPDWETELQDDIGDPTATYEPTGELILALDNYKNINFYIEGSRYRLAYQFDVLCISPSINKRYFVDAITGEIFKELSLTHSDGAATVTNSPGGVQTIDTRHRGWPNNDWVLETDNGDMRIHTKKYHNTLPWISMPEIDKDDEPWTGAQQNATTIHWYIQKSWDYYNEVWGRAGMDNDNGRVRVRFNRNVASDNAQYKYKVLGNINQIIVNRNSTTGISTGDYFDVMGHEFTHGVNEHTAKLVYEDEPGALDESFADIFGLMIERYTFFGSVESGSWQFGHDDIFSRSFNDPKLEGAHHIQTGSICDRFDGQPDTYGGEFWFENDCDYGNVHGNSGVQNHWFYLLSDGGSGINDNGDAYNITGVGETVASRIAYWNLTNNMVELSQYVHARQGAIAIAVIFYGECSNIHYQTTNAWYAVGVGEESTCTEVLSLDEKIDLNEFSIYPNPTELYFSIVWEQEEQFDVRVYGVDGQLVYIQESVTNKSQLSLPFISSGVYIVEVQSGSKIIRKRIIKK